MSQTIRARLEDIAQQPATAAQQCCSGEAVRIGLLALGDRAFLHSCDDLLYVDCVAHLFSLSFLLFVSRTGKERFVTPSQLQTTVSGCQSCGK